MTGWNPWAVLGLAEDVSYDEIQRAYRGKVKQTHPDCGGVASDFRTVVTAVEDLRRLRRQRPTATIPSQYARWLRTDHPKGSLADFGRPPHRASCGTAVDQALPVIYSVGTDFDGILRREMAQMTMAMTAFEVGRST